MNDNITNELWLLYGFPLWTGSVILEVETKFTNIIIRPSHGCTANIL